MRLPFIGFKTKKNQNPGIIFAQIVGFIAQYTVEATGINRSEGLGKSIDDRSNRHY